MAGPFFMGKMAGRRNKMNSRRTFLKQANVLTLMGSVLPGAVGSALAAVSSPEAEHRDHQGWKPTWVKQADGKGGWVLRPAQMQFLHYSDGKMPYYDRKFKQLMPFG